MATALFITAKDLKANTLIDGNVDVNKFLQFIKIAQQIHIQNFWEASCTIKSLQTFWMEQEEVQDCKTLICLY